MATVDVSEIFTSIQGESTYAGLPCFFIRLAGCNLDCGYCDTPQSKQPGQTTDIGDLAGQFVNSGAPIAEITGGEPLVQPAFTELATALRDATDGTVLVETNGSRDISLVPEGVVTIMDVKTPGSGEAKSFDVANVGRLRALDEVKFVVTDRADYEWARDMTREHDLTARCHAVLFGPSSGVVDPKELAGWLLNDRLPVRMQIQLHRLMDIQ
jgi:7-carboxy-7-deazaguanine synthase